MPEPCNNVVFPHLHGLTGETMTVTDLRGVVEEGVDLVEWTHLDPDLFFEYLLQNRT